MNNLISLFKESEKPLGRWQLNRNVKQINFKIDMANEDHCGTCSEYLKKNYTK